MKVLHCVKKAKVLISDADGVLLARLAIRGFGSGIVYAKFSQLADGVEIKGSYAQLKESDPLGTTLVRDGEELGRILVHSIKLNAGRLLFDFPREIGIDLE